MHNINDISTRTSLSVNVLRKCIDRLKPTLQPYMQRGDNNQILFNNSGLIIFDKISQLKTEGLSLPEIELELKKIKLPGQGDETGGKTDKGKGTKPQANDQALLDKLLDLKDELAQEKQKGLKDTNEKDRRIHELEKQKLILENTLKLLPEGKTPEQLKQEYEDRQKKERAKGRIVAELKSTGIFQRNKRKKLLSELEKVI